MNGEKQHKVSVSLHNSLSHPFLFIISLFYYHSGGKLCQCGFKIFNRCSASLQYDCECHSKLFRLIIP